MTAHRGGITTFIIPKRNEKDLDDLPATVRDELDIHLVSHMDEVLALAFVAAPRAVKQLAAVGD